MKGNEFWRQKLDLLHHRATGPAFHLAIFVEPYLEYVLNGTKTVESRFSINKCAPYEKASVGDVILIKKTGGDIIGICEISATWYYDLDPKSWSIIQTRFARQLAITDKAFWISKNKACHASLFQLANVSSIAPLPLEKKDRRGWVVLSSPPLQELLPMEPNILIIISGKIGSGKTTLAHALATTLDYAAISFSDEVRSEAKKRGLRETREDLQMVGEDLVTNHAREFCLAVLARGRALERRGLVVDGLRHVEILDILRRLVAPQKVVHVHIASPDEVAASRALVRGRKGDSKAPSQLHSTEIQVERLLPNQADLCVDGTIAPELLVKLITDEIDLS